MIKFAEIKAGPAPFDGSLDDSTPADHMVGFFCRPPKPIDPIKP